METIKNKLLYAGLDKEQFDALLPEAVRENRHDLEFVSMVALVFFAALCGFNMFMSGISKSNTLCYGLTALVCGVIYLCAKRLPRRLQVTLVLDTSFILALYAFANTVTMLHPDYPAVTSIAVMLMSPFLFAEKPVWQIGLIFVQTVALILISIRTKSADLAMIDTWNAVAFGIIAAIAELFQAKSRFRALALTRHVQYLSETDVLTGVKNRNCYEEHAPRYAHKCERCLVCAFVDVNGLHELNDTQGHKAGDLMLQTVAKALIGRFGAEHTYRIGGDEFVVFQQDVPADDVSRELLCVTRDVEAQGYSISVGVAEQEKADLDLAELVAQAEKKMYKAKQLYYSQSGRDRRRR